MLLDSELINTSYDSWICMYLSPFRDKLKDSKLEDFSYALTVKIIKNKKL